MGQHVDAEKAYSHPAVCDPVMGDDDRLYVSGDLVAAYKDHIVPLATLLTPNQHEAELLTGTKIDSQAAAVAACQALHQRGIATVVRPGLPAYYMACTVLQLSMLSHWTAYLQTESRHQQRMNLAAQSAVSSLAVKQRAVVIPFTCSCMSFCTDLTVFGMPCVCLGLR